MCLVYLHIEVIVIKNIRYINFTNDISYDTIKKAIVQAAGSLESGCKVLLKHF